ncbi:Ig-like domain-containing protein, partial [Vibrio rotiferianus]|uniref:Ig-like domain-containing protein n=1 Tax=Vibrio rotiferianus TaxID=190895 RepID=UPI00406A9354
PAEGETLTVVATITDQAGNTSEPGQDAVSVPVVITPTVSINLGPIVVGDDNTINEVESTGKVTLSGTVDGDVKVGETVALQLGDDALTTTKVVDLGNGQLGFSVDVDASKLVGVDGQAITASVTITDDAGNAVTATDTEAYLVDVDAPTASINLDPIVVGDDNTINEVESTGKVTLSGTVGGDVKVGDTVTLALGENLLTTVKVVDLGNDQLGFSVDVDASKLVGVDGQAITASVTITDDAGNAVTATDTETYQVDVDAPTASIDLDPIVVGDDNVINQAEATGQVTLTGTVGGEVVEGDTVQLKLRDNLLVEAEVIKLADGKLGFSADVDASTLAGFNDKPVTASVTITDGAGNAVTATDTETYLVDVDAPTASIDLDPIVVGDDNTINEVESTGKVTLSGTVDGDVKVGETVALQLGDDALTTTKVVDLGNGQLGFSVDVDASELVGVDGQAITASVTITDGAGNSVTATDTETYQVDVDAPTASINLDPIVVGDDNTINQAESTGKVTLSGTVGGDVKVGDTVTLALDENRLTTVKVVDLGNDQLGFAVDVDASKLVGVDGQAITASVTITDGAGNAVTATDTETYQVDVDAPTASINLDPIVVGDDNTINQAEATGQVTLTGTVGGEVVEGDTVQLKLGANLLVEVEVIKLPNSELGFSVDVDASELVGVDGQAITASVTITDGAGNAVTATDTETYQVDVDAPTASINLDPIVVGGDNTINEAESTGKVTLSGTVDGDVKVGDTVTLALGENLLTTVKVVDLGNDQLGFSVDVDASKLVGVDGQAITASVTITDDAGNAVTATDTETYLVDVDAPTASIDLDPIVVGDDNTINEVESTGKVTLSGTVVGDVKVGDTVTLALDENRLTTVKVVDLGNDQLGFSVDVDASELVGVDGQAITASVTITDGAGNAVTATDTETYQVDVDAPTASINLDPIVVGGDNTINQAESTGKVTLSGTVGGDVKVGETVALQLGDDALTTTKVVDLGNGQLGFSVDVDASKLVGVDGQAITASVTITDDAGNAVTATDTETYLVDVDAPTASINLDP